MFHADFLSSAHYLFEHNDDQTIMNTLNSTDEPTESLPPTVPAPVPVTCVSSPIAPRRQTMASPTQSLRSRRGVDLSIDTSPATLFGSIQRNNENDAAVVRSEVTTPEEGDRAETHYPASVSTDGTGCSPSSPLPVAHTHQGGGIFQAVLDALGLSAPSQTVNPMFAGSSDDDELVDAAVIQAGEVDSNDESPSLDGNEGLSESSGGKTESSATSRSELESDREHEDQDVDASDSPASEDQAAHCSDPITRTDTSITRSAVLYPSDDDLPVPQLVLDELTLLPPPGRRRNLHDEHMLQYADAKLVADAFAYIEECTDSAAKRRTMARQCCVLVEKRRLMTWIEERQAQGEYISMTILAEVMTEEGFRPDRIHMLIRWAFNKHRRPNGRWRTIPGNELRSTFPLADWLYSLLYETRPGDPPKPGIAYSVADGLRSLIEKAPPRPLVIPEDEGGGEGDAIPPGMEGIALAAMLLLCGKR